MMTIVFLIVLAQTPVEPPEFYAPNEELHGYLMEAMENHPGLHARYTEYLMALKKISQVTSLDDPMFTYGQFIQSDVNRFKVMFQQKFPWFGTLKARGEKSAAEAEARLQRFFDERNRIGMAVKKAYFEYALLRESINVTQAQADVLTYMEDTVRAKFSLGLANQDDLVRVSIEQTKLQDRYDGFLRLKPALMAQLNEVLGREPTGEIPWPQEAASPPELPPLPIVLARVRAANPQLRALDSEIESWEKSTELAKKKRFPDFTFGVEYVSISKPRQIRPDRPNPATLNAIERRRMTAANAAQTDRQAIRNVLQGQPAQFSSPERGITPLIDAYSIATYDEPMAYSDGGDDNIMLSLSVNVPLWRKKIRAGIEEAQLGQSMVADNKRQMSLSLASGAEMAAYRFDDAQRRYELYEESLIPQARQAYESLQSQYGTTEASANFIDVLDSVQTLLRFELDQVRAERDWQIGAAELEYLMGGPWASELTGQVHEQEAETVVPRKEAREDSSPESDVED